MRCPAFSDERSLDEEALTGFLRTLRRADMAVMISAKSGTDLDLRRRLIGALATAGQPDARASDVGRGQDVAPTSRQDLRSGFRGEA